MTDMLKEIVASTIKRHAGEMAKNIEMSALVRELYANMPPPKPLTRMERLQRRIQDARDALRVMRGEASYIEWYDE